MEANERKKALEVALGQLEKTYGQGAIMKLGADGLAKKIDVFPTGSLGLDIALGIGGIPRGRICEIFGPESSGKTTLALHMAAEVQKQGGTVVFIDAEHALDVSYAKKLGVDTSSLLVSQPDCGEQAMEICETLVSSGSVDLIIVDSVAALVPKAEIDGEMTDLQPGMQARLMSKALRKLTAITSRSNAIILFINQIRMKIGVMFGSPETTTGGNALKFYSSVRMDIRRIGAIKDGEGVTGNRAKVKIVKNKVAPPFREVEFDIIFNEGISQLGEIIDLGAEHGVVDKIGAWFAFKGEKLGQGRENAKAYLKEHPEVAKEIRELVLSTLGITTPSESKENSKDSKVIDLKSKVELESADKKSGKKATKVAKDAGEEPAAVAELN